MQIKWVPFVIALPMMAALPAREVEFSPGWVTDPVTGILQVERLQNDVVSVPALRLVKLLGSLESEDCQSRQALEMLRGWNGSESAESPQAALFEVWQSRHLLRAFRETVLPREVAALSTPDMDVMLAELEKFPARLGTNPPEK